MKTLDEIVNECVKNDDRLIDVRNELGISDCDISDVHTPRPSIYPVISKFMLSHCHEYYSYSMIYFSKSIMSYAEIRSLPISDDDIEYAVISSELGKFETGILDKNYHMIWGLESLCKYFRTPNMDYELVLRNNDNLLFAKHIDANWNNLVSFNDIIPFVVPKNPIKNKNIRMITLNHGNGVVCISENGSISCSSMLAYEKYQYMIAHTPKDIVKNLMVSIPASHDISLPINIVHKSDFIRFEDSHEFKTLIDNEVITKIRALNQNNDTKEDLDVKNSCNNKR